MSTIAPPQPMIAPAPVPVMVPLASLPLRRITVDEYERLGDSGVLDDAERIELIDGYLVAKREKLRALLRNQSSPPRGGRLSAPGRTWHSVDPIRIPEYNEPEPDVAIIRGFNNDYRHHHPGPSDVGLAVEVSDQTLDLDRGQKLAAYATAGIPVYWIVNLVERQVEVTPARFQRLSSGAWITSPARPCPSSSMASTAAISRRRHPALTADRGESGHMPGRLAVDVVILHENTAKVSGSPLRTEPRLACWITLRNDVGHQELPRMSTRETLRTTLLNLLEEEMGESVPHLDGRPGPARIPQSRLGGRGRAGDADRARVPVRLATEELAGVKRVGDLLDLMEAKLAVRPEGDGVLAASPAG